jgi:hydrogenase nickel incorporation protein HypA/HybF
LNKEKSRVCRNSGEGSYEFMVAESSTQEDIDTVGPAISILSPSTSSVSDYVQKSVDVMVQISASANKYPLKDKHNAKKITKVIVKIGVMSGVETDLLQTAFDTFKEDTICEGRKFVINIQKVVIKCRKCNTKSELKELEYCCPQCKSIEVDVIEGEDMYLMSLEMDS